MCVRVCVRASVSMRANDICIDKLIKLSEVQLYKLCMYLGIYNIIFIFKSHTMAQNPETKAYLPQWYCFLLGGYYPAGCGIILIQEILHSCH